VRGSLQALRLVRVACGRCGRDDVPVNSDSDRLPKLDKSQTLFAVNFGAAADPHDPHWGVRADFREFVAFPAKNAVGFSSNGTADAIWMDARTVGPWTPVLICTAARRVEGDGRPAPSTRPPAGALEKI